MHGSQPLTNLTDQRSFHGVCNFIRRFVSSFVRIAAPLHKRRKKDYPASFNPLSGNEPHAIETLNTVSISPPLLALPYSGGHMKLDTKACHVQIGCVLIQKQKEDTTKPIERWTRSLTDEIKRYETTPRKCLKTV